MQAALAMSILHHRAAFRKQVLVAVGTHVLTLGANETHEINFTAGSYLVLDIPAGVTVSSEQGVYDIANPKVWTHSEEHTGVITIRNTTNARVKTEWLYGVFG